MTSEMYCKYCCPYFHGNNLTDCTDVKCTGKWCTKWVDREGQLGKEEDVKASNKEGN